MEYLAEFFVMWCDFLARKMGLNAFFGVGSIRF